MLDWEFKRVLVRLISVFVKINSHNFELVITSNFREFLNFFFVCTFTNCFINWVTRHVFMLFHRLQTQPAEVFITRPACHVVASTILKYVHVTSWTLFGIACHPYSRSVAIRLNLFLPLLKHLTVNRHMRFLIAFETKFFFTTASYFYCICKLVLNYFTTVCPRTPFRCLWNINERFKNVFFVLGILCWFKNFFKNLFWDDHITLLIWALCVYNLRPRCELWIAISLQAIAAELMPTVVHRKYFIGLAVTKAYRAREFTIA